MEIVFKNDCPYYESNCGGCGTDKINCECAKLKAYKGVNNPEIKAQELKNLNVTATSKFGIMLQMQNVFANRFHKTQGLTKLEKDKWINDYLVCIEDEIIEAGEFLSVYNVKPFNVVEYRKELIDIIHFLMDGMLVSEVTEIDFKKILDLKEEDDLLDTIMELAAKDARTTMVTTKLNNDLANMYTLNYLLRDIRLVRQCISWKHWKKPSDTIDQEKITLAWFGMFKHLIEAFILTGMDSKDVFNVYVNKNIENILRQKYSY